MLVVVSLQVIEDLERREEPEGKLFAVDHRPLVGQFSQDLLVVLLGYARLQHVPDVPQHSHKRQLLIICEEKVKKKFHWGISQYAVESYKTIYIFKVKHKEISIKA